MRTEFTALEYHADGSLRAARYAYQGSPAGGWTILREDRPHLALGPRYTPLPTPRPPPAAAGARLAPPAAARPAGPPPPRGPGGPTAARAPGRLGVWVGRARGAPRGRGAFASPIGARAPPPPLLDLARRCGADEA